jgi:phosphoglycolate phosphatase-like HAD superfamily hydrolase
MKYKLAIFDFNGTLADSFPFFLSVVNKLADKHKFKKIDSSEIETLRGYDASKVPDPSLASVVPTPVYSTTRPTTRFFERRRRVITRALGSPKTPRTVGSGRNPGEGIRVPEPPLSLC